MTKIIADGYLWAINCASCPAPDGMRVFPATDVPLLDANSDLETVAAFGEPIKTPTPGPTPTRC